MDHHPLIVPPAETLRLFEYLINPVASLRTYVVYERVMEFREGYVQLADDEVLVVAGISDDGLTVTLARQIVRSNRIGEAG
jgi:hypothetical protein